MKKILLATLACAAFCACSDELDLGGGGISNPKVFESDKAYITVSISEAGSSSTRATDGGFQSSSTTEKAANNAYFYFFDEDEVFVSDGEVLQTELQYGDSLLSGETITNANKDSVYFVSPTQVVLKGLTQKKYPKYVVTVLNKPDDFYVGDSGETPDLTALISKLSRPDTVGIYDNNNKFVMSTTSYCDQKDEDEAAMPYCVTELQYSDFHLEPVSTELDTIQAVNIFVERLAAKVNVNVSGVITNASSMNINGGASGVTMYRLEESIAGDPNNEGTWSEGSYKDDVADMDVFVQLLGWQLNATARRSYMIKNMDENWVSSSSDTDPFYEWTWNDSKYHRSYWGMSYNYGISSPAYPTNSNGNTDADEYETSGKQLNEYLKYISLKDTIPFGTSDEEVVYCAENTNTAGIDGVITCKNDPAITSAIVKARLFIENDNGSVDPLELISYNGMLYTDTAYMNHILNTMYENGELDLYHKDDEGNYQPLNASYLIIKNMRDESETYSSIENQDGKIILKFDPEQVYLEDGTTNSHNIYYWSSTGSAYYPLASEIGGAKVNHWDKDSTNLVKYNTSAEAYQYTDGYMWYNIPIEHLNGIDDDQYESQGVDVSDKFTPEEANYGVVRNHHYTVTITSISNLGKPITDMDEVIVPDPDDYKDKYYIGADIWVSPWKGVEQNADL